MRLRVAISAVGVAVVLSGGVGVGSAQEQDPGGQESSSAGLLRAPRIDPAVARLSTVEYLISQGVPRDEAIRRIRHQTRQIRVAAALREQAPQSVQSVWIDDSGVLVAGVLSEVGERAARAVGVTPKRVVYEMEDLEAVRDALAEDVREDPPPGFTSASFGIDPARGKVVAQYLFEGADPVVPKAAARFGGKVIASAETGEIQTTEDVSVAGHNMFSQHGPNMGGRCTAGWAVDIANSDGGPPGNGVLTAGHCFNPGEPQGTTYEIDTTAAGNTMAAGEFFAFGAEGDYGYLRLERDRGTPKVLSSKAVEATSEPLRGMTVCKQGAVTDQTCGQIQHLGVTVNARHQGVNYLVRGQVRTDLCVEAGDSGAPVYTDFEEARDPLGVAAVGMVSHKVPALPGTTGCQSYFTPLTGIDNQGSFHVRIEGG